MLDILLGVAELVLVPASVVLLLLALKGRLRRLAVALALVLALTVAQPLGLHAESYDDRGVRGDTVDPQELHAVRFLGLPLFPFRLYLRAIPYSGLGESGDPSDSVRARSWVWPGVLTNGTTVTDCAAYEQKCDWDRTDLWRSADGTWRYCSPVGNCYRLTTGLASPVGLAYWIIAILLVGSLYRSRRSGR